VVRVVHFVKLRFGSVLWCALCDIPVKRCPDRLYSHSFCRGGWGSYFIYVICISLPLLVSNTIFISDYVRSV